MSQTSLPPTSPDPADLPGGALRLGLILPNRPPYDPGTARLLDWLAGDVRMQLTAILRTDRDAAPPRGVVARYLGLEARVAARRPVIATPGFDALAASHPVLSLDEAKPPPPCDVILDLTGDARAERLAHVARYGVWRLSTIDPAAGLLAAMTGAPETPVWLECFGGPGGLDWRMLSEVAYDTKFLASRNQVFLREKAVQLVERELGRLATLGPREPGNAAAPQTGPSMIQMPGYAWRTCVEIGRRVRDALRARTGGRPGRFCLRLAAGTPLDFDPAGIGEFDAPKGQYWADPFCHEHETGTYIFYEVYDYATDRGHISVGRMEGNDLQDLGPVLSADYHLSYPYVFEHEGDIYMLPETHQSGRLEIWRAVDFPMRWELHATALDGDRLADTTLHHDGTTWWLFTNQCRDSFGDYCAELHLYSIDGPDLKQVTPHPLNPVVIGSPVARGGGRIFEQDGRLFRPSQDNSHGVYGYGLNIMEIEVLTDSDYQEHRVRHVTPAGLAGLIGCHHIDRVGDDQVIIDVRRT